MKSEVKEKVISCGSKYPALYKSTTCGGIALFVNATTALAVKGSRFLVMNEFRSGFVSCDNTREWTRLPSGSQVILTQD